MIFADPIFLLGLALVPWLALWRGRHGKAPALVFSTAERARRISRRRLASPGAILLSLRLVGVDGVQGVGPEQFLEVSMVAGHVGAPSSSRLPRRP